MIFLIAFTACAASMAVGFFWGRYEGLKNYEQLRYEAVAFVRNTNKAIDIAYSKLPPWYRTKHQKLCTKRLLSGYRLLESHVKEVEL